MKIQDSVAFVTGAHRGLGLAFTKELLGRGVKKVYAGIRNPNGLDLPGVAPVKVDVTDRASVSAAAARCPDATLLINNAGIGRVNAGALDPALIDSAREIFETNFYGMVRASQAFAPVLAANGGGRSSTCCQMRPGLRDDADSLFGGEIRRMELHQRPADRRA